MIRFINLLLVAAVITLAVLYGKSTADEPADCPTTNAATPIPDTVTTFSECVTIPIVIHTIAIGPHNAKGQAGWKNPNHGQPAL